MTISKREQHALLIGALMTAFLYALAFNYWDGRTLTIWSVDFMDSLMKGRLSDFYLRASENRYDLKMEQSFSQFWYLAPASLWNLPLWIAERFFKADLMHPLALFWGKLWFLVLQVLVSVQVYRLAPRQKLFAAFFCFSSIFTFISAGYAGQNDLFWILISLFALQAYIEDRQLVFMGLSLYAVLLKPYWIFPFVALYLLRDKRLYRIIAWFMAYVGAQLLHMLLVGNMSSHILASPSGGATLTRILTGVTLPTPFGGASVFLLALLATYLWAYTQKPGTNSPLYPYKVVAGIYLLLVLLAEQDFYRYILPIPYLAILFASLDDTRWTFIASTATESLFAFFLVARGTYLFQPIFMEGSALGLPPIDLEGRRFWAPVSLLNIFYDSETIRAGVLSGLLIAVAVTYLLYKGRLTLPAPPKFLLRIVLWLRALGVPLIFLLLTLITYFVPA